MLRHLLRDKAALLVQYSANGLLPLLMVPHVLGAIGPGQFGRLAVALSLGGIAAAIVLLFVFPGGIVGTLSAGIARVRGRRDA